MTPTPAPTPATPTTPNPVTGSPRTSLAGILALIVGGASLALQVNSGTNDPQQVSGSVAAIITGLGLLFARDHKS